MNIQWFDRKTLEKIVSHHIMSTDLVLDIGSGIRPQFFLNPRFYVCIEPYSEYLRVLKDQFSGTNTVLVQATALEALKWFPDRSIDSLFMIDVIEHLDKGEGIKVLAECERVARQQIIIFTPLGFMPQDYHGGEQDGWGLGGSEWQIHKSGWTPDDFDETWEILAAKVFHTVNGKNELLDPPYGAFWAIKNIHSPANIGSVVRYLSDSVEDGPRINDVLTKLLSNIGQHVENSVKLREMIATRSINEQETALREREIALKQHKAVLDQREAVISQREEEYNARLLVRLGRNFARIIGRA